MFRRISCVFIFSLLVLFMGRSADAYLYDEKCPVGDNVTRENVTKRLPGGDIEGGWFNYIPTKDINGKKVKWYDLSYWVDKWGFAQCNCTSYAADRLNNISPIGFDNGYKNGTWSHGGSWDDTARGVGIPVDGVPLPGDIAYWDSMYADDIYGHVAFVEDIGYDKQGIVEKIIISEYNYKPYDYRKRTILMTDGKKPTGYIHFLSQNYRGLVCAPTGDNTELCWSFSKGDVSCSNGSGHFIDDREKGICRIVDNSACNSTTGNVRVITAGRGGGVREILKGPGHDTTATDFYADGFPDFITKRVWLTTPWGAQVYKYGQPETIQMKAQFQNVGKASCSGNIEVHFYLSKGYKEDNHSEWKRVGTDNIKCSNLKPGKTHTETEGLELWRDIPEPGIWNIVACADHIRDDHNNGGSHPEEHESNNCSTEAVFEVTADGQVVNVPPKPDLIAHSLQFLQIPTYGGDQARLGVYVQNIGHARPSSDTRGTYYAQCDGTGMIELTGDTTESDKLDPGESEWEENIKPVTMPNVAGNCTAYFQADTSNTVDEENENNNTATLNFTLQPRPKPKLVITRFEDEKGCCTTNTGDRIKPDIWVRNDGPVAPAGNVTVLYQISSPVATGGAWSNIGYGVIEPRELAPGDTDEDYMEGNGWPIPKEDSWKNQWHTVRGCLREDGGAPAGDPNLGDICATYGRYSKK